MCKCGISGIFDNEDYQIPDAGSVYGGGNVSSGSSSNIFDTIMAGIKGATGILGARYAVPQLNPGQLIQTGPNGQSLMYQGTAGNMSSGIPSMSSLSSGGSMLPLLLVGGVVLFMMKGK